MSVLLAFVHANWQYFALVAWLLLEFVLPRIKKLAANSTVELVANMALAGLQKASPLVVKAVALLATPPAPPADGGAK